MTEIRFNFSIFLSLTLLHLLLTSSASGQFRETYEPHSYLLEWGSDGSGDGQFSAPRDIAADGSGNIYVADTGNHRIQKFSEDGIFVTAWGNAALFNYPQGIAADCSGNVYVADSANDRIQKFRGTGLYVTQWGTSGTGDSQFNGPAGIAADCSGNIYVADTNNHRIQKFDSAGNFLAKWGSSATFSGPSGIAADTSGNVYIADTSNNRIQKFDSSGNLLITWGTNGTSPGQFGAVRKVVVDRFGNVYASDNNSRIQKFDSSGNYLAEWGGSYGSGPGEFKQPYGLATDASGNIYAADKDNHRIQKFTPSLWFDVAGFDSYLSVAAAHDTTAVRTLFQLENNGAPRFAFKNTSNDTEWSFQQSGPGNFLISREGTGGPEMQVYQTGMVRMGPGGANRFNLYPNGNLTIAGSLTANGSTFPDYVFEPDYDLMSLSDLRTFVQREKRLPKIPSAEDVNSQGGHNMTELQITLLEKIEELTLYTLQQDEEISHLRKRLSEVEDLRAQLRELRVMISER